MLTTTIRLYIEANRLVAAGDRVILGVSGGPDSMALLHIMHQLAPILNIELQAAHLNHGLRAEAGMEAALVRETCAAWGIKYYTRTVAVADLARQQKKSVEEAGRDARYAYFRELLTTVGAQRIATAHHYDDLAETVLLHLLRGSGLKGLRGILPVNGSLIRPLLQVTKAQLLAYLQEREINYCLDPSNDDPSYLRNRIRHGLLPYLQQEYNPRITDALNGLAVIARDENDALETECLRHWTEVVLSEASETIVMQQPQLASLHPAYQRRLILQALNCMSAVAPWSRDDVEKVMELGYKSGSACSLHLKNQVRVNKVYTRLVFTTCLPAAVEFTYEITAPGSLAIAETGAAYQFMLVDRQAYQAAGGDICLDYDSLPEQLWLRSRRLGDVFRPPGMLGRKKLKKMFIDLKVPAGERDRIPLLTGLGAEIYAVLGLGVSRMVELTAATRTILVIREVGPGQ
ncbi:MAG: tRNA lysidine(34) synthetase TilS [Firmicutes bacterium]|nr:tRNA lysidine(34) synthetase TilS [Bacillota bacterium]